MAMACVLCRVRGGWRWQQEDRISSCMFWPSRRRTSQLAVGGLVHACVELVASGRVRVSAYLRPCNHVLGKFAAAPVESYLIFAKNLQHCCALLYMIQVGLVSSTNAYLYPFIYHMILFL
jgi:hypothetical protein